MCELCDQGGLDPDEVEAFAERRRAHLRREIAVHRWLVMGVQGDPPFAYTVGLTSQNRPELLVFGLEPVQAGSLLNALGEQLQAVPAGFEFEPEPVPLWGGRPTPMRAFALPNPAEVLFEAADFYRNDGPDVLRALQIVYSDRNGRFPWEPDCQLHEERQPLPGTFAA